MPNGGWLITESFRMRSKVERLQKEKGARCSHGSKGKTLAALEELRYESISPHF